MALLVVLVAAVLRLTIRARASAAQARLVKDTLGVMAHLLAGAAAEVAALVVLEEMPQAIRQETVVLAFRHPLLALLFFMVVVAVVVHTMTIQQDQAALEVAVTAQVKMKQMEATELPTLAVVVAAVVIMPQAAQAVLASLLFAHLSQPHLQPARQQ